MKSLKAIAAALGLVAALSASTAMAAATPLFGFESEALFAPPSFGTSIGTVAVDDGSLTGLLPSSYSLRTRQLLIDSQSAGDYSGILGAFSIAVPGSFSISAFQYSFSVATATSFQFTYNFLTNNGPANSFEVFSADLFDTALNETSLAFEATGISSFVASASNYGYETGNKYVEFLVGPGNYTAQFLVITDQTGCINSQGPCIPTGLVLNSVPEPATLALVLVALAGVVAPRRRRARAA